MRYLAGRRLVDLGSPAMWERCAIAPGKEEGDLCLACCESHFRCKQTICITAMLLSLAFDFL